MTCFWTGIISGLKHQNLLISHDLQDKSVVFFINFVKQNSKKTSVKINNSELSDQAQNENLDAIKNLDVQGINNGYLCSTCDPFLIQICDIFDIDICHTFCGANIEYTKETNNKKIFCASNKDHFWFVK